MGIRGKFMKERGHPIKGKKYLEMSLSHKNQSPWNKGVYMDMTSKKKVSDSLKEYYNNTDNRKKLSDTIKSKWNEPEYRKKCMDAQKGDKSHMWKGGISYEPYSINWTDTLKKSIRERDHYICQLCLTYGLVVHHIDYNKKNCNPENLITLCFRCHSKTNHNRGHWTQYFIDSRRD